MKFLDWLLARQEFKASTDERARACRTCEVLRHELDRAHNKNDRLLEHILVKPVVPVQPEYKPIALPQTAFNRVQGPGLKWDQTRAILEAKDAEEHAKQNAIKKQEELDRIARLEAETGVENAG